MRPSAFLVCLLLVGVCVCEQIDQSAYVTVSQSLQAIKDGNASKLVQRMVVGVNQRFISFFDFIISNLKYAAGEFIKMVSSGENTLCKWLFKCRTAPNLIKDLTSSEMKPKNSSFEMRSDEARVVKLLNIMPSHPTLLVQNLDTNEQPSQRLLCIWLHRKLDKLDIVFLNPNKRSKKVVEERFRLIHEISVKC